MAGKDQTGELSMENYFNEGLADNTEPNNPFEITEQAQQKKRKGSSGKSGKSARSGKASKGKRILIAIAAVLVLAAGLSLFLFIRKLHNDGARYARKLAEKIGSPLTTAQKAADITTKTTSDYVTLNQLFASYQGIAESSKSCRIEGVLLPQWAIFCNTNGDELSTVTYYNYKVLEKHIFGVQRKSYDDPNLVPTGATVEQAEEKLELEPFRIQYLQDKNELREYRYCYEDKDSGDVAAYIITGIWDENGQLTKLTDTRKNYIGTLLASPDQ